MTLKNFGFHHHPAQTENRHSYRKSLGHSSGSIPFGLLLGRMKIQMLTFSKKATLKCFITFKTQSNRVTLPATASVSISMTSATSLSPAKGAWSQALCSTGTQISPSSSKLKTLRKQLSVSHLLMLQREYALTGSVSRLCSSLYSESYRVLSQRKTSAQSVASTLLACKSHFSC